MPWKIPDKNARIMILLVIIILCGISPAEAQYDRRDGRGDYLYSDSLTANPSKKEDADRFYDSLRGKRRSGFGRFITRILVTNRRMNDETQPNVELEKSQQYFEDFAGKEITDIRFIQANVFERYGREDDTGIEKFVNSLHVMTKEKVLAKNLLFEIGDLLDPYTMAVNERRMRGLPNISSAFFLITPDLLNENGVIINIFARDRWSLHGSLRIGRASSAKIYDENFLGTGDEFIIKYYFPQNYQKNAIETTYIFNNVWGTFANVEIAAGTGSTNNILRLTAERPFILPNDHIYGLTAGYKQNPVKFRTMAHRAIIDRVEFSAWYGHSRVINPAKGTNMFFSIGGEYEKFKKRPYVTEILNPFYHTSKSVMFSMGFARQSYYQGNMIFTHGVTEDIPYGHKFDITTGVEWNEFYGRRYYLSSTISWGQVVKMGYYNFRLGAATYIDDFGDASQGIIKGEFRGFSPLYRIGKWYARHFLNLSATWGFNRKVGENEILTYTRDAEVRGLKTDFENMGYNRFTIGMESVFFAPIFFYHFRFAFNVWGDLGWLGYHNNPFRNPSACSVGIGIRIHNERLAIKNLSIRLGIGLKVPEGSRYSIFKGSVQDRLNIKGFAPGAPSKLVYE